MKFKNSKINEEMKREIRNKICDMIIDCNLIRVDISFTELVKRCVNAVIEAIEPESEKAQLNEPHENNKDVLNIKNNTGQINLANGNSSIVSTVVTSYSESKKRILKMLKTIQIQIITIRRQSYE